MTTTYRPDVNRAIVFIAHALENVARLDQSDPKKFVKDSAGVLTYLRAAHKRIRDAREIAIRDIVAMETREAQEAVVPHRFRPPK